MIRDKKEWDKLDCVGLGRIRWNVCIRKGGIDWD